jgi:hypothetical protein
MRSGISPPPNWRGGACLKKSATYSRATRARDRIWAPGYEKFDPVYLARAVEAIDAMMQEIQKHTSRNLFADENKVVALKLLSKEAS